MTFSRFTKIQELMTAHDQELAPRHLQPARPYKRAAGRIAADLDNEMVTEEFINLTQTDQVRTFEGNLQTNHAGEYVYLFYDISPQGDRSNLVFAEGVVVPYPFPPHHVKWCCKLRGPIESEEEYRARLGAR